MVSTAWTPRPAKRTSLHTGNADEAQQIIEAKNNSERPAGFEPANSQGISGGQWTTASPPGHGSTPLSR